ATGFVGAHLIERLRTSCEVVGLTRSARPDGEGLRFRQCDLFSSSSTRAALEGVDVAFYLVHSMLPSSRLFQGDFHDTDLLLADNFAKACARAGVKRIVYLGGLVPPSGFVSKHLASRLEVEGVLRSSGIPVTCLRAGMIVGPGGSSFEILCSLVSRLPWMVLPRWTRSKGQAIFLDDVLSVLVAALEDPAFVGRTFDVVNGEELSYESLLRETARALGKRRYMVPVPIASTGFSKRWIQLFSGGSYELISPLVDSLQCDLPALSPGPEIAPHVKFKTFASMVAETRRRALASRPGAEAARHARSPASGTGSPSVRSIQRLPVVPGCDARYVSDEYVRWLPRFLRPLLRVEQVPGTARVAFCLAGLKAPLLVLEHVDLGRDATREKFHIVGGLLSRTTDTGWLEFRSVAEGRYTLAAIQEFVPSLPWPLYVAVQAPLHGWVMNSFGRHLRAVARS
ncbi:MAG: NAD(P)H-binding protein, partial [Deltaproteobacteria bacterium]|nr:NAD(P)H-binding protein [Deltaproteobacteria bacterium]